MNVLSVIVILGGLVALAVLAVRKGKTGIKPEPPPEISEEDLNPPAPELPDVPIVPPTYDKPHPEAIIGALLTLSDCKLENNIVYIKASTVNPDGGTFYLVTRCYRASGLGSYGTSKFFQLWEDEWLCTGVKVSTDLNPSYAIRVRAYDKIPYLGGTLLTDKSWSLLEITG